MAGDTEIHQHEAVTGTARALGCSVREASVRKQLHVRKKVVRWGN